MPNKFKNLKAINTLRCGCGEIEITSKYIDINYRGDMGNTEVEVEEMVDELLGKGVFAKLRPHGSFYVTASGSILNSAAHGYTLRVPIEIAAPFLKKPIAKANSKKIAELKATAEMQLFAYHKTMAEIKRLSPPKKPATFEDYHEAGRDSEPTPSGGMGASW